MYYYFLCVCLKICVEIQIDIENSEKLCILIKTLFKNTTLFHNFE